MHNIKEWKFKESITEVLDNYPTKGILVKLSGGADSSIIYYKLCTEIVERKLNIPLYVATVDAEEKDWYSHYAKKVIEFTKKQTGIEPVEHRIKYISNPWTIADYSNAQEIILRELVNEKLINVYYGGLTKNPNPLKMATKSFKVQGMKFKSFDLCLKQTDNRDFTRDNTNSKFSVSIDCIFANECFLGILPFVHKDKKEGTANMYKQMGVLETLYPLTYSCEERDKSYKTILDVVDGFQEYSHCGQCWFCIERAYAFGRLV